MSKPIVTQNTNLLTVLQSESQFLKRIKTQWLEEIALKAHFFVFSNGTILAKEKQDIDYFGIILEGRVSIAGKSEKEGPGFTIGELGYFNILGKHANSITGDSDGIILAIRFNQLNEYSENMLKAVTEYITSRCLSTLAKAEEIGQVQEIEEKKAQHLFLPEFRQLLNQQIDPKQKINLFKYFPLKIYKSKDMILRKNSEPTLLIVIKGEIIARGETPNSNVVKKTGQYYNTEGFLLNYSQNRNVYCLSEEAIVMSIPKRELLLHLQSSTFVKISNFLLRKQINDNAYEIESYDKKREKEIQSSKKEGKWSVFQKNYYEILPLNISSKAEIKKEKTSPSKGHKPSKSVFMGTLFQDQLAQKSNAKTNSSNNSKISKLISFKTEKNQELEVVSSSEKQIQNLQKQVETLSSKMKYFEENYVKAKLDAIHFMAKFNMQAVFREINGLEENRHKRQANTDDGHVTTLKDAFEKEMKENRIKEVVARCAYKWLWAVRRKKGLKANSSSLLKSK